MIRKTLKMFAIAALMLTSAASADLIADFRFDSTLESSVPYPFSLIDSGPGVFAVTVVNGVETPAFRFPRGGGLRLPTANELPADEFTIVMVFALQETNLWRKLVDFKNGALDSGLYVHNGHLRFFDPLTDLRGCGPLIEPGQFVQVTLTRDRADRVTGYFNGVEAFKTVDSNGRSTLPTIPLPTLLFFADDSSTFGEESSGGDVTRIQIYDEALAPEQVAAMDQVGPAFACLNEERFEVEVKWETANSSGLGRVVPHGSDDSTNYWFFSPDNWELLVKVLDGCSINSRYWVFFAATTDVRFEIAITDTRTSETVRYVNPLFNPANAVTDTQAFSTCE